MWKAQSTVSSLFFRGGTQIIDFIHGHGAQEECKRLLETITSQIPPALIFEYAELEDRVLTGLKDKGYSKSSPACEFRIIGQSEKVCTYGVFLVDDSGGKPLLSFSIEATELTNSDDILDGIAMDLVDGDLSAYNIRNTDGFLKQIAIWMSEHLSTSEEEGGEPIEWTVSLETNVETGEIQWIAENDIGNLHKAGAIYISPVEFQQLNQVKASAEIRHIFEIEVIPEVEIITNLDDVLEQQIPDIARRIRMGNQ